ncbi:hypothetical protein [Armatimonas sp.]|uniref:hypothetical protein n=1 Tax=Armatimonas sp. TaxID=1872638 RepID=UPI00286D2933|nr:hypothetical protein [Armatimonas sp.]
MKWIQNDTIAGLQAEFKTRQDAYYAALRKEKRGTPGYTAIEEEFKAFRKAFATRGLALVQGDPKATGAFELLVAVLFATELTADIARLIERHYLSHPEAGKITTSLYFAPIPEAETLLEALRKQSPHPKVRGQASYWQAKRIMEGFSAYTTRPLPTPQQPAAAKKCVALLEEVIARYPASFTLYKEVTAGEKAKQELAGAKNLLYLRLGAVAPEIQADDPDGKRFKLSDYRGTVVMLDFWGNW